MRELTLSASMAIRHPRGLPPYVDPCSPGFIVNITSSSHRIADTCGSYGGGGVSGVINGCTRGSGGSGVSGGSGGSGDSGDIDEYWG